MQGRPALGVSVGTTPSPLPCPFFPLPQVRLLDGTSLTQTFQAREPLAAVRLYVELQQQDGAEPFQLLTSFPRRVFTEEDMEKPLQELGRPPRSDPQPPTLLGLPGLWVSDGLHPCPEPHSCPILQAWCLPPCSSWPRRAAAERPHPRLPLLPWIAPPPAPKRCPTGLGLPHGAVFGGGSWMGPAQRHNKPGLFHAAASAS